MSIVRMDTGKAPESPNKDEHRERPSIDDWIWGNGNREVQVRASSIMLGCQVTLLDRWTKRIAVADAETVGEAFWAAVGKFNELP